MSRTPAPPGPACHGPACHGPACHDPARHAPGPTRRLALAAALGLGGCSILPRRPYEPRREWPLAAPRPDTLASRPNGPVLLVRDVVAAPGLEARGLQLLQPDGSVRTEVYEEWAVPPPDAVADSLRRWLAASGLFAGVLAPGSRLHPALVLEAELTTFVAVPAQGVARAGLAVVLLAQSGAPRLLLQRTLRAEAPLAGEGAPAVATALVAALAAVLALTEAAIAPFG